MAEFVWQRAQKEAENLLSICRSKNLSDLLKSASDYQNLRDSSVKLKLSPMNLAGFLDTIITKRLTTCKGGDVRGQQRKSSLSEKQAYR